MLSRMNMNHWSARLLVHCKQDRNYYLLSLIYFLSLLRRIQVKKILAVNMSFRRLIHLGGWMPVEINDNGCKVLNDELLHMILKTQKGTGDMPITDSITAYYYLWSITLQANTQEVAEQWAFSDTAAILSAHSLGSQRCPMPVCHNIF